MGKPVDKECNEVEDLMNSVTILVQEGEKLLQALDATEAEKLRNELTNPTPSPVLQLIAQIIADMKRASQMTNASLAFDAAAEVVKDQKSAKLEREPAISSSFDGRGGGTDEDDGGRARPDDQAKRGLVSFSHPWRDMLDSDSEDAKDAAEAHRQEEATVNQCKVKMDAADEDQRHGNDSRETDPGEEFEENVGRAKIVFCLQKVGEQWVAEVRSKDRNKLDGETISALKDFLNEMEKDVKRKTTYRHAPLEADRLHPRLCLSTARKPSNVEQEDKEVGMAALGKPHASASASVKDTLLSPRTRWKHMLQINGNLYEESQGAAVGRHEPVEFEFCTPLQAPRLGRLLEHNTRPHHQLSEATSRLLDDAGDEHELVTRSRIFRSRLCRDMVVAGQRCVVANNLVKSTLKEAKGRKDTPSRTIWGKMLGPDQELADFRSAQLLVGRGLDFGWRKLEKPLEKIATNAEKNLFFWMQGKGK
jgi:hypothetical protein